ncbi:mechanosensitive ion channel family protein [Mesobacillus harenae]|uniref:mechanosensitive ion channel family protein n=1 Tax=Mesobacillus harenae TaxID=2213203 RepID=UPI0030D0CC74
MSEINELFDGSFLNTLLAKVSIQNIVLFLVYSGLIIASKWLIIWMVKAVAKNKPDINGRVMPVTESFLNWLSFYGIILLFLFTFSKEEWLFYTLFQAGDVNVSLFLIVVAIMIVSLASRLVKVFTSEVLPPIYNYYNVDKGISYTINHLIYYSVMIAALGISLTTVGLDLTALGAILGVLGIGIGFGMRNIAGNFISGIIILFERPIEVGEVVEVNNKIGKVENIRLRSTIIRTIKEGTLIVPNQYFIEQVIKNRTEARMLSSVTISVAYGMDTEKVETLLHEAVKRVVEESQGNFTEIPPDIRFIDFRNKSLDFLVEFQVADFRTKELTESRLRHVIAELFFKNGIEMASFPLEPGNK